MDDRRLREGVVRYYPTKYRNQMPRRYPPPAPEGRAEIIEKTPYIRIDDEFDPLLGEIEIDADEIKTGVIAAVIDCGEIPLLLQMINLATRKADETKRRMWVVRSTNRLYVTNVPPVETRDLDAMYLVEVNAPQHRSTGVDSILVGLQALGRRVK